MIPESFSDTLEQFLLGALPFESAAHALSQSQETHFVRGRADDTAPPDVRARGAEVSALLARAAELTASARLRARGARALRIDDWSAPANALEFYLSIEVELTGRDALRTYQETFWLNVCTPSWLVTRVHDLGPTWVMAPLLLPRWDPALVHRALDELVQAGSDETWSQYVARLSRTLDEYR
jgi:hypothetical protein